MDNNDVQPIMTDLDADQAHEDSPREKRRSWIVRFASIFGLANLGQGGGTPGGSTGVMGQ